MEEEGRRVKGKGCAAIYSPLQELWKPCPFHSKVVFTQCGGAPTALILPLHSSFPHTLQPSPSHTPTLPFTHSTAPPFLCVQ